MVNVWCDCHINRQHSRCVVVIANRLYKEWLTILSENFLQGPTWSATVDLMTNDYDGVEFDMVVTGPHPKDMIVDLYSSLDGQTFSEKPVASRTLGQICDGNTFSITDIRNQHCKLCFRPRGQSLYEVRVKARVWRDDTHASS